MVKILLLGLSGDTGCQVATVGLHETLLGILKANELVYAPTLMDAKEIPEKIDVAIIEGGVRTEHEIETTKKIRERSSILITLGSCACFGGVPGLANLQPGEELLKRVYSQKGTIPAQMPKIDRLLPKQQAIGDYVKVDFKIPGCPPETTDIASVLTTLLSGGTPELCKTDVCELCPRERIGVYSKKLKRIYEEVDDPKRCLLEQGFLCMGPATMGGCGAPCPKAGMPCDGCRGPTAANSDQGLTMLDALTSLTREANENFSLPQYVGTLYRYTYPSSRLAKVLNGGGKK
ncbi:TPA: F420-nonreducing hydrogenase [Candidatus Bathyarchaeota archaeon]|nr:F420-nonreducing hydrogenase [Candidatus Bathyarchaeota archaeon]